MRIEATEFGKLPPQAREFEELVIAAAMIEEGAMMSISSFLTPEMFYVDAHRMIFQAMMDLTIAGEPIDTTTVYHKLKSVGNGERIGGPIYLVQLTSKIGSAANIEYHARIIQQMFILREAIRNSSDVMRMAYEDGADIELVVDQMRKGYEGIISGIGSNSDRKLVDIMTASAEKIFSEAERHGMNNYPYYLTDVDLNCNIDKGHLVIIGARPGAGKTSFALDKARKAAKKGRPVGFISLEMDSVSLGKRLIVQEGCIDIRAFKNTGGKDQYMKKEILNTAYRIADTPLYLCEESSLTLSQIIAKVKMWRLKYGVEEVFIDYLQLITLGDGKRSGNREQEVSQISRSLKLLARSLNIPITALSQLSRPGKGTVVQRPRLTDLRESGAIEQDADIVQFLHRPEYYGVLTDEMGQSTKGMCEVITEKQRDGEVNTQIVKFVGKYCKFFDWDSDAPDNKVFDGAKKAQTELFEKKSLIPMREALEREEDNA